MIIVLNVINITGFDDETKITECFEKLNWCEKVTVNVSDRTVIVSGKEVTEEKVIDTLKNIGYKVI